MRYSKAISAKKAALGTEHADQATGLGNELSNLGGLLGARGSRASAAGNSDAAAADFEQAVEHCRRAVQIFEAGLGPNDTTTADAAYNLGRVLYSSGDIAGALGCYVRATAVYTETMGREHPETIRRFKEQASCMFSTGDL